MRNCSVVCAILCIGLPALAAEPVSVVSGDSISNPKQPQAVVTGDGTIYVTFGAGEAVYCTRSTDDGKSFAAPVKIADVPGLALGLRRGPRIVASPKAVVVTALSHKSGNVLSWRSTDGGETWQGPVQVNDSPKDAREGLHAMAISPNGDVFCTWLDVRKKGKRIYGAVSTDGGASWSENREVYASPSGSVCECCHPAAAYDRKGNLYVMWRNSLNGYRDLFVATSQDGGKTFSPGTKMGTGTWKLDACPMDGGWLAETRPGDITSVWRREKKIFRTDSTGRGEQLLGTGMQPWIAGTDAGAYIVWINRRNGDLWLMAPKARRPVKLASGASDPVVAATASGKGPVVAVWETGERRNTAIMAEVLRK